MKRLWVAAAAGAVLVAGAGAGLLLSSRSHPDVHVATNANKRLTSPLPTASAQPSASGPPPPLQPTMPSCSSGPLFSVSPIPVDKLTYIVPLGGPNPIPGDHLYFVINRAVPNTPGPVQTVNMYAPGDLTATKIGRQVKTTNGIVDFTDYFMFFAVCREVSGGFGHVSSLTGPLGGIPFDQCDPPYSIGDGSLYEHCNADVRIPLRAGELIGTAGGLASAALDFDMDDSRLPVPYVANSDRQYDLTAACALDYYQGDVGTRLRGLLGHGPGRQLSQGCGQIFQDRAGTLQGNWFNGTPDQTNGNVSKMMALVHENFDGGLDAISIGGTVGIHGVWDFTPTHTGTTDREFSEVTPGGSIYCYQAPNMPGRILIQLVTATTLSIEHQSGACTGTFAFVSAFAYQR